jgi:hypothetical protein
MVSEVRSVKYRIFAGSPGAWVTYVGWFSPEAIRSRR